jgi:hypothetical protein
MKPRWEPLYQQSNFTQEVFVGYVAEFDMYIDWDKEAISVVTLVSEHSGALGYNFESFRKHDEQLVLADEFAQDLNITPYHMCLIYAKAIEHGLIKEQEHGLL